MTRSNDSASPGKTGDALRWFYGLSCFGSLYLAATNTLGDLARIGAGDWLRIRAMATEQLFRVRAAGASPVGADMIVETGDMIISAILRERNRRNDLDDRQKAVEGGRQEGLEGGL